MPSTLQFKFNINLDDIVESRGRFFPSEYADITSEKEEWKLMPEPTPDPVRRNGKLASAGARDKNGNLWGLEIRVDNFTAASIDEYEFRVYKTKVEPRESVQARKLGSIVSCTTLIVRDEAGEVLKELKFKRLYNEMSDLLYSGRTPPLFMNGSIAAEAIRDNSLIIEMVVEDEFLDTRIFNLPRNKLARNALELLDNGEDADVFFQVNGVQLPAHKLILKMNATQLHSFLASGDASTVVIEGTTPELFLFMLRYIYGDDDPEFDYLAKHYQEIIEITDKYNIIGLKLAAQAAKIATLTIGKDNVTDILLFAHDKNCFLLKEYATKIYVSYFEDLIRTDSLNRLAANVELLRELMVAVNEPQNDDDDDDDYNDIIGKMIDYDLDFDGPKDVLISRLEDYENA